MASLVVILQSITLLATVIGSRSGGCDGGMKKVILSLALGTFGLGMAEFGIMGVLTELAHNVGISIPAGGHMISYYALGVVVGAPIIALFSSRYSLKHILLFLVALCVIGNAMFTLSSSYLMLAIGRLVSGFPHGKLREQFHFLRSPAPWLIFAATMFGNAGVFAWFSYVKPYMMFISGFSETAMTFIMMLVGLGMVLGNMLSGRISGRYSPLRIAAVTDFIIVLALLMLFFFGGMKTTSLIFAFICCAGLFALSAPLQILLLQNAKGGELLGAAGGQIAFNLGSAVGAYCGGMMLTLGLAYNYVALPAALLSFAAMSSLLLYGRYKRQQAADSSVLAKPLG